MQPDLLYLWKNQFKRFCCYEDSENIKIISNQFNTYELQEKFQISLIYQFVNKFLISDEYIFLFIDKLIEHKVPISASVYGEEQYLREDEKNECYLHPSDLYAIEVPRLWRRVFNNCNYRLLNHAEQPAVQIKILQSKSTTTWHALGYTQCSGKVYVDISDKFPP